MAIYCVICRNFRVKLAIYCVICHNLRVKLAIYCVICRNLRVFGVNFILQKFCLCKKNDKYEVCVEHVSGKRQVVNDSSTYNVCLMFMSTQPLLSARCIQSSVSLLGRKSFWLVHYISLWIEESLRWGKHQLLTICLVVASEVPLTFEARCIYHN